MTGLTPELLRGFAGYTDDLFAPEDPVLAELARRTGATELAPMQVSASVGKLLHVLALAVRARRILELGTLFGYSAIWMARALPPDGRLITLEADAGRASEAESWIRRAGLERVVEVRVGPALELLARLTGESSFDLVFLDAAKQEYPAYLEHALALTRPGSLVVADNTLFSGSSEGTVLDADSPLPHVRAIREFNDRIATDARLASIVVPMREGVSISYVRE